MSELPEGVPRATEAPPRPSAAGIVLWRRGPGAEPRVLLGLRSRRGRFMPGHLACPGGGLEAADGAGEGAYARCASRELAEEAGLSLAPERWRACGARITPPLFPIRFDTRFFVAELPPDVDPASVRPASDENECVEFARPASVLEGWARGELKLPPPLLPLLRALAEASTTPLERLAERLVAVNAEEERAPRIEFVPDVWVLPVRTATLPPATHTNVWMPGGRRFVLIDPGSAEEPELARLLAVVERRRALGHEPVATLLTHHHQDHVAGVRDVCTRLGLPLWAHAATLEALGPELFGLETRRLSDGERIELDGLTLRAWHTPGHAAGHLAFEVVEHRALVAGDLLSGLSTILIDPVHGDMQAYLASLRRTAELGFDPLFPGHGPPLPRGKLEELIAHRLERERRIATALEAGIATLSAIAAAAYAESPELPPRLIEGQTLAHLLALERQGVVERTDPAGGRWHRVARGRPPA